MIKRNTTPVIDAISEMRITGNIKPPIWRKTIVYTNTKGTFHHSDAADLLADIRYWYTRQEIRDERTSEIIEYRKRFKEDKLQRSYNDIAEYLNCSMKLARQAVKFLADLGVITLEFRNIKQSGGTLYNVMYIELVPSVLQRLTYPDSQMGTADFPKGKTKKPKRENGKAHLGGTYTENTPETTNKENILSEVAIAPTDGGGLNELKRQLDLANEHNVERLKGHNSVIPNNATTENATVRNNRTTQPQTNSTLNDETSVTQKGSAAADQFPAVGNMVNQFADTGKMVETAPETTEPIQTINRKDKTAPRAPKQPKTPTIHAECVRWFCETFYPEKYGVKYCFQGGKDGKAVTTILSNLRTNYPEMVDEIIFELFKRLFTETANEWVIKLAHSPAAVASKFNEINVELKQKKAAAKTATQVEQQPKRKIGLNR